MTICNMDAIAADVAVIGEDGACVLGRLSLELWKQDHAEFLELHSLPLSLQGQSADMPSSSFLKLGFLEDFSLQVALQVTR